MISFPYCVFMFSSLYLYSIWIFLRHVENDDIDRLSYISGGTHGNHFESNERHYLDVTWTLVVAPIIVIKRYGISASEDNYSKFALSLACMLLWILSFVGFHVITIR